MRFNTIFTRIRIRNKLLLMNLMIYATFFLILCIVVFSFVHIRNKLSEVTKRDMGRVISNSQTTRDISVLCTNIDSWSRNFYGNDDYLKSKGSKLVSLVNNILKTTSEFEVKKPLLSLRNSLEAFLDQCFVVNQVIQARESIDRETHAWLSGLENLISRLYVNNTMKGKDTTFAEQLLALVIGYRESLFQIDKLHSDLGHEHYFIPLEGKTSPVIVDIDDLFLRLQTISASTPDVARYGQKIVNNVRNYRGAILRFYEVMEKLNSKMSAINHSRILLTSSIENIEKKITSATQLVSKNIDKAIFSSAVAVFFVSIIPAVLLGVTTAYLIKSTLNDPMQIILKGLESFRKGDFDKQIELNREDEWDIIEKGLNNMAADLLKSYSALKESEKKFRLIAEAAEEGIAIHDQGVIVESNEALARIFGYDLSEMIGIHVEKLVSPEAWKTILKHIDTGYNERYQGIGVKKNGSTFYVQLVGKPYEYHGKTLRVAVFRNITQLKRAEEFLKKARAELETKVIERTAELSESKELLEKIFASQLDAIFVLDSSASPLILDCNPAAEKLFGYKREEMIGRSMEFMHVDFRHSQDFHQKLYLQIEEIGIFHLKELEMKHRDGTVFLVNASGTQLLNERNEYIGMISVIHDISVEKLMEQELIQADKMISLGILVSGVAHEINNPNNFIMLNAPLLKEVWKNVAPILDGHYEKHGDFNTGGLLYSEMKEEVPNLLNGIERGSKRIKRIVKDLKDFSRHDKEKMDESVNINDVIRQIITLLHSLIKKSTQSFSVEYGQNLPSIQGSNQKLEQVMINLIQNACHALPDTEKGIYVTTAYDGASGHVLVTVQDEGIGMPDDDLNRIMDPFFTTKRDSGGTGLGLSVSSNIIKEHEGKIEVRSEVGKGSRFIVHLPVKQKKAFKKILVVDDDDGIREIITTALSEYDMYSVYEASNGTEASLKLGIERPDLIILDIQLPEMDGVEICRLIKTTPALAGTKIVIITGYPNSPKVKEAVALGFENIMFKPFKIPELLTMVDYVLKSHNDH